jgi:predicted nucleic acid-binding protein
MISCPIRCVLDASVGIKTVIPEVDSANALALVDHATLDSAAEIHVPEFFYLECRNLIWKLVFRALLPEADVRPKVSQLESCRLRRTPDAKLKSR